MEHGMAGLLNCFRASTCATVVNEAYLGRRAVYQESFRGVAMSGADRGGRGTPLKFSLPDDPNLNRGECQDLL